MVERIGNVLLPESREHRTLRQDLKGGRYEVGHLCLEVQQQSFLLPISSLFLSCQPSLILSEKSSYLGEGPPPNWHVSAQPTETSHESTWRGTGSKEPISSLRKTWHRHRPLQTPTEDASQPLNTLQAFTILIFSANSFWELNWFFFPEICCF